VLIDGRRLTVEDVTALSRRERAVQLGREPAFVRRIEKGPAFIAQLLKEDGVIYGVTTGYGDSVTVTVPPSLVPELGTQLFTYHGCGLGAVLSAEETRAVLIARLQSLSQGFSGVSFGLLEQLERMLQHDILPVIP